MNQDVERQLTERIQALEARIDSLEGREPQNSPEAIAQALTVLMNVLDTFDVQRILREFEREQWSSAFAGQPLEVLLKLRGSVSKNSWNQLVEDWQSSTLANGFFADQDRFIRLAIQLMSMGEISCRVDIPGYKKLGFDGPPYHSPGVSMEELQEKRVELLEKAKTWREQVLAAANQPGFVRLPSDLLRFEGEGQ